MNDPIILRDQADRQYSSRVEGIESDALTVAMPLQLPVDHDFEPGSEILITWKCARGIGALPTRLAAVHTERGLRLWSVVVSGPGWIEQRRKFVRVPAQGSLILTRRDDEKLTEFHAHLVDLSEGALRCVLAAAEAKDLAERDRVRASFIFGEGEFAAPGVVTALRPGARPSELTELVVLFDEPVQVGDALRKAIFAQQIRTVQLKGDRPGRR